MHTHAKQTATHQLRFQSLFHPGRAFVFPCDGSGQVDRDELEEPARQNYFFARALVGRDFACPSVQSVIH